MLKSLAILLALLPSVCLAQIQAPENVKEAEAIHVAYTEAEPGDVVRWELLNPFPEPSLKVINTKYGADLIVDPPIGWKGVVRVQCIVVNAEQRVKYIGTVITKVAEGKTPNPEPEPKPVDEYNGPNVYGVGKISYEKAPEGDVAIANLLREAGAFLKGRPKLKVVATGDPNLNKTDYNVFVWLKKQLPNDKGWQVWYEAVMQHAPTAGVKVGSPLNDWVGYFNEIASGVEAKQ